MKRSYLAGFIFFIALTLMGTTSARAYENEINSVSAAISGKIATSGKKLVAVIDFVDLQGSVTELGRFLAEEFSTAIAGSGKGFEVVDRANLKMILAEHKLSATGIIDPATARKLGQVAGVQALITGTITPFGDSVRLSVKVLDTETAKVISAANVNIARTKAIEELLAKGIETGVPSRQATAPTSSKPQPKTEHKVEVKGFIFEAKGCKVSSQKITCYVSVINSDQQTREIRIIVSNPQDSMMVDDLGNQYTPAGIWFGAESRIRREGGIYIQDILSYVPPNLPMNLVLGYEERILTAKHLNIVVDFRTRDNLYANAPYKAVLRNIPLSR